MSTVPDLSAIKDEAVRRALQALMAQLGVLAGLVITDGVTPPQPHAGQATVYIDRADGDLKVIFGNGFVRTIGADS